MAGRVREYPRVECEDVQARYRKDGADWREALVGDLSAGGVRLLGVEDLSRGEDLELRLVPKGRGELQVSARVMRVVDGVAGLRFEGLTDAQWEALEYELKPRLDSLEPEPVETHTGQLEVSSAGLQCGSLYESLGVDPAVSDDELRETAELILTCIDTSLSGASGPRHERLLAAKVALERQRALWTDTRARAGYDMRWGFIRADDRIASAARGEGLAVDELRDLWGRIFPASAMQARDLVRDLDALDDKTRAERVAEAVRCDPFNLGIRSLTKR
jgi:hypothetical protein